VDVRRANEMKRYGVDVGDDEQQGISSTATSDHAVA